MTKDEIERLWREVYLIDGLGLADFLNDLMPGPDGKIWRASRYGEVLYAPNGWAFSRWDKWRENVAYYFDAFTEANNEGPNLSYDEALDVLVFALARITLPPGVREGCIEHIPKGYENFLFM